MLPLFPLGMVQFPGLVLPLHIFEERYRALVADLLARPEDQREFGIIAIREGCEVGTEGVHALYAVGCATSLRQAERYDDGRYDIVTVGSRPFRIDQLLDPTHDRPYFAAEVSWLDDPCEDPAERSLLDAAVREALAAYLLALCAVSGAEVPELDLPESSLALGHLVGATMVLDLPDRQDLLDQPDTLSRLRRELSVLRRETGFLVHLGAAPAPELVRTPYGVN